jgi:hypothetical protein
MTRQGKDELHKKQQRMLRDDRKNTTMHRRVSEKINAVNKKRSENIKDSSSCRLSKDLERPNRL